MRGEPAYLLRCAGRATKYGQQLRSQNGVRDRRGALVGGPAGLRIRASAPSRERIIALREGPPSTTHAPGRPLGMIQDLATPTTHTPQRCSRWARGRGTSTGGRRDPRHDAHQPSRHAASSAGEVWNPWRARARRSAGTEVHGCGGHAPAAKLGAPLLSGRPRRARELAMTPTWGESSCVPASAGQMVLRVRQPAVRSSLDGTSRQAGDGAGAGREPFGGRRRAGGCLPASARARPPPAPPARARPVPAALAGGVVASSSP